MAVQTVAVSAVEAGEVRENVLQFSRRQVKGLAAGLVAWVTVMSLVLVTSASASSADPANSVNNFLSGVTGIVRQVAPFVALLAFIGLGIMYMGASIPMIADWKKDNPKAANSVVLGLIFVLLASGASLLLTNAF